MTKRNVLDIGQTICSWSDDADEQRRAYVIEKMVDPSNQFDLLELDAVCRWLKDGTMPREDGKPKLLLISKEPK